VQVVLLVVQQHVGMRLCLGVNVGVVVALVVVVVPLAPCGTRRRWGCVEEQP